jgi:hypothetical protein
VPKISSAGVPSNADGDGIVTNATGEQFDLSPQPVDEPAPDDEWDPAVAEPDNQNPAFDTPKPVKKTAASKK